MSCGRTSRGTGLAALAAMLLAAGPVAAGVVFREAEQIETFPAGGESSQVRQVSADAERCKVLFEAVSDGLVPVGAFVLASPVDAFLIDPAGQTIAPLAAIAMEPVAAVEAAGAARIADVVIERQLDEPGPALLGWPTRHRVYQLRYTDKAPPEGEAPAAPTRWEERHELWLTPWPKAEALTAWQALRVAEDAGPGADRREIREALAEVYADGLVLRQVIVRRASDTSSVTGPLLAERVWREVTALAQQDLPAGVFERPTGYAHTEFLAPQPAQ